ncbi:MAG: hypothetical protein LAO78_22385 [Acidobacteriia bacterium]|nr:hypothetical protein [Terriglobia bacterium]
MAIAQNNLLEWGSLWVGSWSIQGAIAGDGGKILVANGSHTIRWGSDQTFLIADCIMPVFDSSTGLSMRWTAVFDSATGTIKQTSVDSDGTTEVAFISKDANGLWGWQQTRSFPNGATETNVSTFTISNGGKTVTQNVTNRVLQGATQPLAGYTSATGASPSLGDVCYVLTKTA